MKYQVIHQNSLCKIKEGAIACSFDRPRRHMNDEFTIKDRNLWGVLIDFAPDYMAGHYYKIKIFGLDKSYYFTYNDFNIVEEGDEFYQIDEVQSLLEEARNNVCEQEKRP